MTLIIKSPEAYMCRFRKDVPLDSEHIDHDLLISDDDLESLRYDLEMFFDEPERNSTFNYRLRRSSKYEVELIIDPSLSRRERTVFFMNKLNYIELGEDEFAEDLLERVYTVAESKDIREIKLLATSVRI